MNFRLARVTVGATHRKGCAHPNDLYVSFQAEQFCSQEFHQVTSVVIVNHVQLVQDYHAKIVYSALFDSGIDQHVGLKKISNPPISRCLLA